MCGIVGFVGEQGEEFKRSTLLPMLGAIVHRGPDDEGSTSMRTCAWFPTTGDHRSGLRSSTAGGTRTKPFGRSSMARYITSNPCDRELESFGHPFPDEERYRSHRPCLRAMGRRFREAAERHVRLGRLDSLPANACSCW